MSLWRLQMTELIIVDDSSMDHTKEIVEGIGDPRIRYYKLAQNSGPSAARNYGVSKSSYKIIAFADSDDVWHKNKLEKQLAVMDDEIGLVFCAYSIHYPNGKHTVFPNIKINRDEVPEDLFRILLKSNQIGTPTVVVRKELLEEIGGFNESLKAIEDWDLALRLSRLTNIRYVDEVLMDALYSEESVSKHVDNHVDAYLKIYAEMLKDESIPQSEYQHILITAIYLQSEISESTNKNKYREDLSKYITNDISMKLLWRMSDSIFRYKCRLNILSKLSDKNTLLHFWTRNIELDDVVAVYGLGDLGIGLINCCESNDLEIRCVMDRSEKAFRDYEVIEPNGIDEYGVTKIIVTVPEQFDSIQTDICKNSDAICIDVSKI